MKNLFNQLNKKLQKVRLNSSQTEVDVHYKERRQQENNLVREQAQWHLRGAGHHI